MNWKPLQQPPPPGWGISSLTDALDKARGNQFATFYQKAYVQDLLVIDRLLFELLEGHIDPQPIQPMQFLLRAHSCFRATVACAMAGQTYEATVLQRAVLEAAAYGLYIRNDVERGILWLKRSDSASSKEKVRKEFGFGSLRRDFEVHYPELAELFVSMYETVVDFGAHPNEAAFSISTDIRHVAGQRIIDTVYMHDGDGIAMDFGLKNTGRVGLWIVLVFRAIFPDLYARASIDEVARMLFAKH